MLKRRLRIRSDDYGLLLNLKKKKNAKDTHVLLTIPSTRLRAVKTRNTNANRILHVRFFFFFSKNYRFNL